MQPIFCAYHHVQLERSDNNIDELDSFHSQLPLFYCWRIHVPILFLGGGPRQYARKFGDIFYFRWDVTILASLAVLTHRSNSMVRRESAITSCFKLHQSLPPLCRFTQEFSVLMGCIVLDDGELQRQQVSLQVILHRFGALYLWAYLICGNLS